MVQYDRYIMNKLLDAYERSGHFTGRTSTARKVSIAVDRKNFPAYFDESSAEYEQIHAAASELSRDGYVTVMWKRGNSGIMSKIILNMDKLDDCYAYVKRKPGRQMQNECIELLQRLAKQYDSPVCQSFAAHLVDRIEGGKSVKEYIDVADKPDAEALIKCVHAVWTNETQSYIREFSIKVFGDSKKFENILGRIIRVMKDFGGCADDDAEGILAEHGIYRTPNYVYLKGSAVIYVCGEKIDLTALRQGIGISGDDIAKVCPDEKSKVKRVVTIENLTTFFSWNESDSLTLYLGGYHNSPRRMLLRKIYECYPAAEYLHFGDIDAGGFDIYRDLCDKTGIPFQMYHMDLDTLKRYEQFARPLTENDRKRLTHMRDIAEAAHTNDGDALAALIAYMLKKGIKLEQEAETKLL